MSRNQYQMNFTMTSGVKALLIANVGIWLVFQVFLEQFFGFPFSHYFALYPGKVLFDFSIWQLFSYMFLHTRGISHLFFNMIMLWFLGAELENRWGKRFFVIYYLATGIGAAIIYCLGTWIYFLIKPSAMGLVIPVMGASGAVFGLLLAYGIIFAERMIYVFGVFPMKAKIFVLIMGFIEFASLLTADANGGDVAYLAHLGGIASGYLILVGWNRFQTILWSRKAKKKNRKLRLVVDNEKEAPSNQGPKYWN